MKIDVGLFLIPVLNDFLRGSILRLFLVNLGYSLRCDLVKSFLHRLIIQVILFHIKVKYVIGVSESRLRFIYSP